MSFLPPGAQAAFNAMGHNTDREVSLSKGDSELETNRARQAHYIEHCRQQGIVDPCGDEPGWSRVVGIYGKSVALGCNCVNKVGARSATISGYYVAVNALFKARNFREPANFDDPQNYAIVLLKNLEAEENIANQRSPITKEIYVELLERGEKAEVGSEDWLLAKFTSVAKIIGPRASEFAQKTQSKVDFHKYPSGKTVVKAFTRADFTFYDKNGKRLTIIDENTHKIVGRVKIRWRIQKNRQNGQKVTVVRELIDDKLCSVLAALEIYLHSVRIGQPEDMPMLVMKVEDKFKYLTANRIAKRIRDAAKKVHPDWAKEEINKLSCHSFRVWACVLLSEAGASPDFIKNRLRWLGDSYRLYLRDTLAMNEQHRERLEKEAHAVMALLGENFDETLLPDVVPEDTDMGEYHDLE